MAFPNDLNREFYCQCLDFTKDLVKLTRQILAIQDKGQQRITFVRFMVEQVQKKRVIVYDVEECSINIPSHLLRGLKEFENNGMTPSTLLLEVITSIYFKDSKNFRDCLTWQFHCPKATPFPNGGQCFRTLVALRGRVEYMKMLVNFGMLSGLDGDSPHLRKETSKLLLQFVLSVGSSESYAFDFRKFMNLLMDCFFPTKEEGEVYKRVYLVAIALHAIAWAVRVTHCNSERRQAQNFISCLRMYFSAMRDLFITLYEVRSVLFTCCILINKENFFDGYSQQFDNLMPDCPADMQPRKLTDLARCRVRESLNGCNIPLPSAVDELQLPGILKSFIIGDVIDVSRKKGGNTPLENPVTKLELKETLILSKHFTL